MSGSGSGSGSPSRGSPSRSQRRPLHERSNSQSNSLAIRIVPYSPPRPSHKNRDSTASASSSRTPTSTTALLSPNPSGYDHTSYSWTDDRTASRASDRYSHRRSHSSSTRTSVLSPASSTFPLVSAKDSGVSGSKLRSDSLPSDESSPTTPVPTTPPHQTDISHVNARSRSTQRSADNEPVTPSAKRPLSRRRNLITLNADGKTFSLLPQGQRAGTQGDYASGTAPRLSLSTTASHERLSDAFSENRPSSTVTSYPDQSFASTLTPASSTTQLAGDSITSTAGSSSSPWNYRMVGGLRKVPNTPDLKQKQKSTLLYPESDPAPSYPSSPSGSRLAPLPEAPTAADSSESSEPHDLQPKTSFQSSVTASTTSEKTNYKVYGSNSPQATDADSVLHAPSTTSETTNYKVFGSSLPSSPEREDSLQPPSSSHSNYVVLGRSSPPEPSSAERSPPKTADSEQNYVVLGASSPAPSSVASSHRSRIRPEYSQESLLVAPLKPYKAKKRTNERFGYYKARSRDSLRRAASVKSISGSLTLEAAQSFLASPAAFYRSRVLASQPGRQPDAQAAPTEPAPISVPAESHMTTHPHQWSSQLSTVISESEGDSEPPSRSVSPWSVPGRRGSIPLSSHSRQMLSISSSLAANEERSLSHSRSFTDSLERPQATHSRGNTLRMVSDRDEHGDGLAELNQLHQRPSRTGLSSFFSSSSSDRNLHSSSSSRANSLNSASIPAWAKFYYGSGERRFLASSGDSIMSDPNDSRPPSSFQSGTPSVEQLAMNIYSPRRRPREVNLANPRPLSDVGSMEINQAPLTDNRMRSGLRKKTSSIWSPHLRRDQRAGRHSIWEPPSMAWSAETSMLGKRNVQVAFFALGFIFPFAWMIAAFLPLPPDPQAEMAERDPRSSLLDEERDLPRRVAAVDETLFQSARWWRALNRYMSVIGLLVVGAIAALVVVGVKQGWGQMV
ncbi:uncharacterized protein BDZ83DRAFT_583288 [Colletotrichum acutatum]|uniref:Serine-rich protein n=1 Tax=Glomerella acutata TaxID=27357 RepID=A0AAD8XC71_GLOAC|nr:uncharacterized protein BDZ83DRAFT_583288 [Colletotrichum acutatum]KAK1722339.1 hypothetical protein BDZ83DRAFT_583288 [Colletotrichum acutatum]